MHGESDAAIEAVYRADWGRIVAALISLVGDFEIAQEAAQEAFAAAVDQWRTAGVPEFPRAWIIQTARHKAIDGIRRSARHRENAGLAGFDRPKPSRNPSTMQARFPTTGFA